MSSRPASAQRQIFLLFREICSASGDLFNSPHALIREIHKHKIRRHRDPHTFDLEHIAQIE
jgi:hypothetical protein